MVKVLQFYRKLTLFLRPSEKPDKYKLLIFLGTLACCYLLLLTALISIWYSQNINTRFHWFDDSAEWRFCDKLGHIYIAFTECRLAVNLFNWSGIKGNKNLILSFLLAFLMQSAYEVFDGFAADYGASVYDLMANFTGALLVVGQYYLFDKIKLSNKFNFSLTHFAALRPEMLGKGFWERYFKDYNGQTYWYSVNLREVSGITILPKWLMISLGYGGYGLLGGHDNVWTSPDGKLYDMSHVTRASRFYLSLDIDFNNVRTGSKWLDHFFYIFTYIKIPLPGIEFNTSTGIRWRWFCY